MRIWDWRDRARARWEHAFLLRCEGYTYRQIGERMGVSKARAERMVRGFAHELTNAMRKPKRKTRVYWIEQDAEMGPGTATDGTNRKMRRRMWGKRGKI
jgi:hypothetical protein